jgi:hypothetical protein
MFTFGEEGAAGALAGVTIESFTGEESLDDGLSSSSTASIRLRLTACAIAAAWTGDSFSTAMLIRTVLMSDVAEILRANDWGVTLRPKLSITG